MLKEMMYYTQVADEKMIEIFQSHENISPKAITLFSHVLNAQHIWAHRILGNQSRLSVWGNNEVALFAEISKENFNLFEEILAIIPLDQEITYTNSLGNQYKGLVKDILFHAFNHSTYHRGQIATLFKSDGIHPPLTDYIMLKRDHQL